MTIIRSSVHVSFVFIFVSNVITHYDKSKQPNIQCTINNTDLIPLKCKSPNIRIKPTQILAFFLEIVAFSKGKMLTPGDRSKCHMAKKLLRFSVDLILGDLFHR